MENKHIILFDGNYNFYNYFVNYIIDRDHNDIFRFASLQSEKGKEILKQHQLKDDLETVVLIDQNKAKTKSTAALYIFKALGWPNNLVAPFVLVPKLIRDWVYSIVAKYRKRLMKNKSCAIPTEAIRKKFID